MNASESVTENVLESVADYTNTDPVDLPLLYESINPDALETIIRDLDEGQVSFSYADLCVTVQSDGTVNVTKESDSQANQLQRVRSD